MFETEKCDVVVEDVKSYQGLEQRPALVSDRYVQNASSEVMSWRRLWIESDAET
jgi:hypothetical protein